MKSGVYAIIGILTGVTLCSIGFALIGVIAVISISLGGESSGNSSLTFLGIGVLASLLGSLGIVLERYDKKIAALQYVICGIFVFTGGLLVFGVLPAIFFFLAGYGVYKDEKEEKQIITDQKLMVQCPYCKSHVPNGAVKCKFCGEWIVKKEEK